MVATLTANADASALPDFVASPDELVGDIFVAHVKSRQEKAFARELNQRGLGYYLPLADRITNSSQRRRYIVTEPVFTGYVFVAGDQHAPAAVMGTGRVCQTIRVADQLRLRSDLMNLHRALIANPQLRSCEITKGQRVRVTTGAFMGVEGVVVRLKNSAVLVIEVRGFGQAVTDIEIDGLKVEPV